MIVVVLENRVGKVKVALIQRRVCRTTDGKPSVLSTFSIPGQNGCIYTVNPALLQDLVHPGAMTVHTPAMGRDTFH